MNPSGEVVLSELVELVGGQNHGVVSATVTGVAIDSNKVEPGDLFVALPGHKSHGAHFVEHALDQGAQAVVTDPEGFAICESVCAQRVPVIVTKNPRKSVGKICARVYGQPTIPLIGITGTNGKTTTAFMVFEGIKASGRKAGMVGTLATFIGEKTLPSARTTPEAPDIYRLLRDMHAAGVEVVVMEVSSIAIAEHRIGGLAFDVVGFTNLSHDHLDYHGTMDSYFAAKAELFTDEYAKRAVINIADIWGKQLLKQTKISAQSLAVCRESKSSCVDQECDWCGEYRSDGKMKIHSDQGVSGTVSIQSPGIVNAENALLAIALLANIGIQSDEVSGAIAGASVPGRGELVAQSNGVNVYVDYAHSPDAITNFLAGLAQRVDGSIITVVGAGGDRDQSKRETMGHAAAEYSSHVVVTDDNPRSEDPAVIREAVAAGARQQGGAVVESISGRRNAIVRALEIATEGDAIAILGKGHENTIEINGVFEPFSDAAVARELMSHV